MYHCIVSVNFIVWVSLHCIIVSFRKIISFKKRRKKIKNRVSFTNSFNALVNFLTQYERRVIANDSVQKIHSLTYLALFFFSFYVFSQQTFVFVKTSLSSSSEDVFKTSSRRLDKGKYIHLTHTSSEDVFKTSSRRLDQDQYICLGHTSSRRLQDVLQKHLQGVFKTSSRHLQDILQRYLQDVFKTYHQVKLFA